MSSPMESPRWTLKEYDDGYWLRAPGAPDTDMIRLNGSYYQFVRLLKALKEYEAVKAALADWERQPSGEGWQHILDYAAKFAKEREGEGVALP